ncbi:MAG: zinc ribbon domain-containing protein [Acidaminococcaceae bacterium]|nr:zinc ribbon domain-containing protein [Acidaminococcaceae bacterium]
MRIDGAGGCFDNRLYELDIDIAWKIVLLSVNEMGVTIDEEDRVNYLLKFHSDKKIMQVHLQKLDSETIQVIMDAVKQRLQIYNWKQEDEEVNLFYKLFEGKLREYQAFILCPECHEKISSLVKFCPECGAKVK